MHRYFHVPSTEVGLKYFESNEFITAGEKPNPRYEYLLNYKPVAYLTKGETTWLRYLDYLKERSTVSPENWHDLLDSMTDVSYRINNRYYEKIFEEVRLKFYKETPSRFSCLYLADIESVRFWYDKTLEENKIESTPIFEIELIDAKIHFVDREWLEVDIVSEQEYIEIAHKYWKGEKTESFCAYEILSEGRMRIINRFNSIDDLK